MQQQLKQLQARPQQATGSAGSRRRSEGQLWPVQGAKVEQTQASNFQVHSGQVKRSKNKLSIKKYQTNIFNRHISPSSSSSQAFRHSSMPEQHHKQQAGTSKSTVNLAGQLVLTGATGSGANKHSLDPDLMLGADNEAYVGSRPSLINISASKGTFSNQFQSQSQSQASLSVAPSSSLSTNNIITSNSTAQLHSLAYGDQQLNSAKQTRQTRQTSFSIKRQLNLKYIKTIIILLLAIDLLITVFVHQFSSQDYLSLWFTSVKLRFSLLNLVLSAIWFIILIGAILYDIYFILVISFAVDVASFFVLLGFSFVHFYRKIDYNTVNLTSLLLLLFSIIVLHVYLVVLSALTMYLMQAVRRRQKCPSMHT